MTPLASPSTDTAPLANAALSNAVVAHYREQAGLPELAAHGK